MALTVPAKGPERVMNALTYLSFHSWLRWDRKYLLFETKRTFELCSLWRPNLDKEDWNKTTEDMTYWVMGPPMEWVTRMTLRLALAEYAPSISDL